MARACVSWNASYVSCVVSREFARPSDLALSPIRRTHPTRPDSIIWIGKHFQSTPLEHISVINWFAKVSKCNVSRSRMQMQWQTSDGERRRRRFRCLAPSCVPSEGTFSAAVGSSSESASAGLVASVARPTSHSLKSRIRSLHRAESVPKNDALIS